MSIKFCTESSSDIEILPVAHMASKAISTLTKSH